MVAVNIKTDMYHELVRTMSDDELVSFVNDAVREKFDREKKREAKKK